MERTSGILLPIFSLPSEYGIGSLGAEARDLAGFLHRAGQSWWQVLPVGPAGAGNSPYTSESTYAGNPLFIDLEQLRDDGLLTAGDLAGAKVPPCARIDYTALRESREMLLRKAFIVGFPRDGEKVAAFAKKNPWIAFGRPRRERPSCWSPTTPRTRRDWTRGSLRFNKTAVGALRDQLITERAGFFGRMRNRSGQTTRRAKELPANRDWLAGKSQ